VILLAACQPYKGHEFRTWLQKNHYRIANDSTALIVEYTVSDCLNCDYRINGFVHDLQQRYSLNDTNVFVVVDYKREAEQPQIKQVLFQLFRKDFQLIQQEKVREYLNSYKTSVITDAAYRKGNARYYIVKL
jgi:hypothetical protein